MTKVPLSYSFEEEEKSVSFWVGKRCLLFSWRKRCLLFLANIIFSFQASSPSVSLLLSRLPLFLPEMANINTTDMYDRYLDIYELDLGTMINIWKSWDSDFGYYDRSLLLSCLPLFLPEMAIIWFNNTSRYLWTLFWHLDLFEFRYLWKISRV